LLVVDDGEAQGFSEVDDGRGAEDIIVAAVQQTLVDRMDDAQGLGGELDGDAKGSEDRELSATSKPLARPVSMPGRLPRHCTSHGPLMYPVHGPNGLLGFRPPLSHGALQERGECTPSLRSSGAPGP
jgi:hypothetical protein